MANPEFVQAAVSLGVYPKRIAAPDWGSFVNSLISSTTGRGNFLSLTPMFYDIIIRKQATGKDNGTQCGRYCPGQLLYYGWR